METKNKYFAITIGPIIKTLSMARKPRDLWAASYMFSELMKRLMEIIPEDSILSPAVAEKTRNGFGLYPDRLFCKNIGDGLNVERIKQTVAKYAKGISVPADYFKVYAVEIEGESDRIAIKTLNEYLDNLELHNVAVSDEAEKSIRDLICKKECSPLFELALKSDKFSFKETLSEIASAQLEQMNPNKYQEIHKEAEREEELIGKDIFIKKLSKHFVQFQTPHKYICIVHADGDNVGKIANSLPEGQLKLFSKKLLDFGEKTYHTIKCFQGFPIYAGGDDVLFIAPVISGKDNTQTIFDLIERLDKDFTDAGIRETIVVDDQGTTLTPSMSYGISITYYKYPLYEALEMSREQLLKVAKKITKKDKNGNNTDENQKNALAWVLQKSSGSTIKGVFSKNDLSYKAFRDLIDSINEKTDNNFVSAVAHKIRINECLLGLIMESEKQKDRLDAFFDKILEYNSKNENERTYMNAVKELFINIYAVTKNIEETVRIAYTMLRTSRFIKGLEDDKDE